MLSHEWCMSITPSQVQGTAQKTRSMGEQKERKSWRKKWILVVYWFSSTRGYQTIKLIAAVIGCRQHTSFCSLTSCYEGG